MCSGKAYYTYASADILVILTLTLYAEILGPSVPALAKMRPPPELQQLALSFLATFSVDLFSGHLTYRTTTVIHLHAPRKFLPDVNTRTLSIREAPDLCVRGESCHRLWRPSPPIIVPPPPITESVGTLSDAASVRLSVPVPCLLRQNGAFLSYCSYPILEVQLTGQCGPLTTGGTRNGFGLDKFTSSIIMRIQWRTQYFIMGASTVRRAESEGGFFWRRGQPAPSPPARGLGSTVSSPSGIRGRPERFCLNAQNRFPMQQYLDWHTLKLCIVV